MDNGTTAPVGVVQSTSNSHWGGQVALRLEDVYYSPERPNLFSQYVARTQSFKEKYNEAKGLYTLSKKYDVSFQAPLRPCGLWMITAYK